tara:strand:+ start:1964 stop:2110 length:147 start_codon:yes stop_codon:yes gene_type:complete
MITPGDRHRRLLATLQFGGMNNPEAIGLDSFTVDAFPVLSANPVGDFI